MKPTLAPLLLALTILISGCGLTGSPDGNNPSTETGAPLSGGVLPLATLPPISAAPQGEGLPTLVPTISIPAQAPVVPTVNVIPPTNSDQTQRSATCLIGSWEVADLPQVMAASLEQSDASLTLEQVEGRAMYVFDAEGGVQIIYEGLSAALSGQVDGQNVVVVQSLDGSGTARYAIDPSTGEMLLTNFGGDGIQSRLMVNGQTLAEGSVPVWQAIAGRLSGDETQSAASALNRTRASIACSGDNMTITALEPIISPPVRLTRLP